MRMASLISRVFKEITSSSKVIKTQPLSHNFPAFNPRYQPWKRAFSTAIGETEPSGFKVNVTSREMIKPSSPTRPDKKIVRFSFFDQLAPNLFIPIILFYKNDDPINNINPRDNVQGRSMLLLLKKSLSETLTDFPPLAGRIQGNELIDCTDQGVEFCEAHSSKTLFNFLENNPSLQDLQALLPFQELLTLQGSTHRNKNIVLSVQVNHFSCGGTAISVCLNHKIADATSTAHFLRAWAAKVATLQNNNVGSTHILSPNFNGASLFPPVKELNEQVLLTEEQYNFLYREKTVIRRLIFDKKAIDELKEEAIAANPNIIRPTRVEVVTDFICKHWPKEYTSLVQLVNLRKRMVPPTPEDFFGNCIWFARTSKPPGGIIQEFRKVIEKISGNYMKELFSSDNFLKRLNEDNGIVSEGPEEVISYNSLSGLPLYEVNFGTGNPIWACFPNKLVKNVVFMMSTECGRGIEAWVCMHEDEVAKFERSLSQLSYPILRPMEMN